MNQKTTIRCVTFGLIFTVSYITSSHIHANKAETLAPIKFKVDASMTKKDDQLRKFWSGKSLNSVLSCIDAEDDAEKTATNSILGIAVSRFKSGVNAKKDEAIIFIGKLRNTNHTIEEIKPAKVDKEHKHALFQMKGRGKLHQCSDGNLSENESMIQGRASPTNKEPPATKIPERHIVKPPPNPKFRRLLFNILY